MMIFIESVTTTDHSDLAGGQIFAHNRQPYVTVEHDSAHCPVYGYHVCTGRAVFSVNRLKPGKVEYRYLIDSQNDFDFNQISPHEFCHSLNDTGESIE